MKYTIIYNNLYKHSLRESLYTTEFRDFGSAKKTLIKSLVAQMSDLQRKLDNVRGMTEDQVIDLDKKFNYEGCENV